MLFYYKLEKKKKCHVKTLEEWVTALEAGLSTDQDHQ